MATQAQTKEAFVVGSGPNGLTAAIALAQTGFKVTVLEAQPTAGGGARSAALTLPGFIHDICSAVHPFAVASPAFAGMPLTEHGLTWIQPPTPLAHPLDGGEAALAEVSVKATAARLGPDGNTYRQLMTRLSGVWSDLIEDILAPPRIPRHPFTFARFGLNALWPAAKVGRRLFREEPGRALFAGCAAHSILPLEEPGSAAFGLVFALAAHSVGWPVPRGGSQSISNALISYLEFLGGRVLVNENVRSLSDLPTGVLTLCDVTPQQFVRIAGNRLPDAYCRNLERYRNGPGVFKVDWALSAPIPWRNMNCARAGTVHVGGTLDEIAASEHAVWEGSVSSQPFVLLAQPSLFDATRAPDGKHTAWAYCHVPNGSKDDMTSRIEAQVERFAPGFGSRILGRHTMNCEQLESRNANLVGGDIAGGANTLTQLLFRPTATHYRTPLPDLFLCSASTPPGGGVHGMCGYHAAQAALSRHRPV